MVYLEYTYSNKQIPISDLSFPIPPFLFFNFLIIHMIHKIQTSNGGLVVLEVRQQKLYISKGSSILTFDVVQTNQLNAIIQSIDASKYVLKEYGSVKK